MTGPHLGAGLPKDHNSQSLVVLGPNDCLFLFCAFAPFDNNHDNMCEPSPVPAKIQADLTGGPISPNQ
jgi:hypothetical protein